MKNIFKRFLDVFSKNKPAVKLELGRIIDARFELNEMAVGISTIKTRRSVMFWVEHISELRNIDFLVVALILMDEEIERQKGEGIKPKIHAVYPERRQYRP